MAWECQNLQEFALENTQAFQQTLLPPNEYLFIPSDRPIIEYQPEESPITPAQKQQELLVSTQDQAPTEFKWQQKTCEAFTHQELTFSQPSQIYTSPVESQDVSTTPDMASNQQSVTKTPIQPVEPVLCITSTKEHQIHDKEGGQDIEDILGTTAYKGYVKTSIQTLNGLYVTQPRHFLPLAEEAKKLVEALQKEKEAKQWVGIPHKNLLNQSFLEQLEFLQILEQLTPLHLDRKHLQSDIIDILERLGKADNIPFNQLYALAENCTDRYYSKVIKTFILLIKSQFTNRQTLLVNTAHALKFLEEYGDR